LLSIALSWQPPTVPTESNDPVSVAGGERPVVDWLPWSEGTIAMRTPRRCHLAISDDAEETLPRPRDEIQKAQLSKVKNISRFDWNRRRRVEVARSGLMLAVQAANASNKFSSID
jgi:hypothetical protein